jgi:hypothetical protein
MKRIVFFFSIILAASTVMSQTRLGVEAGILPSHIKVKNGSNYVETDNSTGVVVGVMANTKITRSTSLTYKLLYAQKGSEISESGSLMKIHLDYLEVPVLFNYHINRLSFKAGPFLSYGISGKMKSTALGVAGYSYDRDLFHDENDENIKRIDAGYVLGAGLSATDRLIFNIAIENSFSNMDPDNNLFLYHAYNRSISFTIGYYLK